LGRFANEAVLLRCLTHVNKGGAQKRRSEQVALSRALSPGAFAGRSRQALSLRASPICWLTWIDELVSRSQLQMLMVASPEPRHQDLRRQAKEQQAVAANKE